MPKGSAKKVCPFPLQKAGKKHGLTFCACEKVDQTLFLPIFMVKSQRRKKVRLFPCKKLEKNTSLSFCIAKRQTWHFAFPWAFRNSTFIACLLPRYVISTRCGIFMSFGLQKYKIFVKRKLKLEKNTISKLLLNALYSPSTTLISSGVRP